MPNNYNFKDFGIISIMYHRFNENKYPSTNIQLEIFKKQLQIIEDEGINLFIQKILKKSFKKKIIKEKFFLTIDDGLLIFL